MGPFTILIVDDEKILARSIKLFLEEQGYEAEVAEDGEKALSLLETMHPDLVFLDVRLPKISGIELLKRMKEFDPHMYVVVMTAYGSIEGAVEAMKLGAFDYLKKPVDLDELKILLNRAHEDSRLRQELSYYRERETRTFSFEGLIGKCEEMQRVFQQIRQIASLEEVSTVLITGETGTGKGLVARAIHVNSSRASAPFIEIDCTALPATLVEAELFGYEKGSFTDAKESKMGLFEAANGGTLFLDEIGDLELPLQGKLLRALEERMIRRIGSLRDRKIDARIIAATNKHLEEAIAQGSFRKELYYRLAVFTIHLPPLRQRGEDILLLAKYFLERISSKYAKPIPRISDRAARALVQYHWPGNVRELKHVMERAVLACQGETLEPEHLSLPSSAQLQKPSVPMNPLELVVRIPPEGISLPQWERALLEQALQQTGGNQVEAARLLGITRDTLRYRMKKFKIPKPR